MKFASDALQQEIKTKIERMFDLVRLHLLGVEGRDKIEPEHIKNFKFADTLKGMYMHAHSMHHTPDTFDKDLLEKTIKVAGEYIDKAEQQATADVMRIIGSSLDGVTIKAKMLGQSERELLLSPEGKQIVKQLTVQLGDQFDKVVTATEKIVAAETIGAQNMGQISGIMGASKALGIEDPTVLKYGVIDERLCLWEDEFVIMNDGTSKKLRDIKAGDILRHPYLDAKSNQLKYHGKLPVVLRTKSEKKQCIELLLDNGKKIVCTEDHPILCKKKIGSKTRYLFVQQKFINDSLEVVDDPRNENKHQMTCDLKSKSFMDGLDSCDYWRVNLLKYKQMAEEGRTRKEIINAFGLTIKQWDRDVMWVLRANFPDLSLKRPPNRNNVGMWKKRYLDDHKKLIQLGGLDFIKQKYNSGYHAKGLQKDSGIMVPTVRSAINGNSGFKSELRKISRRRSQPAMTQAARKSILERALLGKRMGNPNIFKTSKPELAVLEKIKSSYPEVEHNKLIFGFRVDFLIPSMNLVIEYDGSGHDRAKFKKNTVLSTQQRDYARDHVLKKNGLKVLRIKSTKDRIPSEESVQIAVKFQAQSSGYSVWHVS